MTVDIASLLSDNLDIWTTAVERKSGAGRGGGKRISHIGINRLRALILDLAMRGKLVAQDPTDEPAAKLLQRIAKARDAAGGKSSKGKIALQPVDQSLPEGWEIVRLDELANSQAGFAFKSKGFNERGSGLPLIRIRDVGQPFTGTFYSGEYREEFVVQPGDYLVSMDGEFRVAQWEGEAALLNQRVSRLQFYSDEIEARFVAIELQIALSKLQGVKAYTTVDHLSGKQIAEARISLPPLAEQQRIVAKVDELMALCDALEAESAAAMAAHQALVEALLATLTASTDAADLATNWSRLEAHFDTLFTTEASVEALKQTTLDLAVRGKLVAQDTQDETAARLLFELTKQRSKMIKSGAVAKHNPVEFPRDWKPEFEPPSGWLWECFGNYTAELATGPFGTMIHKSDYVQGGIPLINPSHMIDDRIVEDHLVSLPEGKASELSSYKLQAGDIVFARRGEVGRLAIVTDREAGWLCGTGSFRARFAANGIQRYLALFFRSDFARDFLGGESVGATMSNLNHAILNRLPIPIPPLAEQHRIVAKVDELMALCDALKARIAAAATTQWQLADAITEQAAA